jgi:hypothetical protein
LTTQPTFDTRDSSASGTMSLNLEKQLVFVRHSSTDVCT